MLDAVDDLEHLRVMETAMWAAETRCDRCWMDAHLSPTFTEFGRSGRVYDRAEILALDVGAIDVELSDVVVRQLAPTAALVTYRSIEPRGHSNRTSVWVRADGRWLLDFHQGTPTEP